VTRPDLTDHDTGVLAALATMTGVQVGDADGTGLTTPYAVLHPIPGGSRSGTVAAPEDDCELVYQVTCVGDSRRAARWVNDKVDAAMQSISVTGRFVGPVLLDSNPGVLRDTDVTPHVFYSTPRYRVFTTTA